MLTSVATIRNTIKWNNDGITYIQRKMLDVNPLDVETKRQLKAQLLHYMSNVARLRVLLSLTEWSQFKNGLKAA